MPAVAGNAVHVGNYIALLDCLHENIYKCGEPSIGDTVWCARCYEYQTVMHVIGKYTVRCKSCRYARNYGGELTARTKADSHSIRKLGHRVLLILPEGQVEEKFHALQMLEFPNF